MTLGRHLEEATEKLKDATYRIEEAREKPLTLESLKSWLDALTDFSVTVSEIQAYNNESIHEKLHEISERTRIGKLE